MKLHALLLFISTLTLSPIQAAENAPWQITRAEGSPITVDGRLDEPIWQTLPAHSDMFVVDPDTLESPPLATTYRFLYTEDGFYLGVWNQQSAETLVSRLGPRDDFMTRDDVSFTLDPSGKGLYGYWFAVALSGSVIDGTVVPERQFSSRWDGPWLSATARHKDGWSAEMFLPWSMMTMPAVSGDTRRMGFYMSRAYADKNERWGYPALPRSKGLMMSQLQAIELDNIQPKPQLTFYPFAAATHNQAMSDTSYKAGFDFYWRPSSNLQLTATVNPDFGNVESDNIVVNLTSFETFFSEKRPFFLEGQEIFVTSPRNDRDFRAIAPTTTLVNTRRIGGPPRQPADSSLALDGLESNQPSELIGAAKVTGQAGRIRYGLLLASEDDTSLDGIETDKPGNIPGTVTANGRDFGIARVLYEDTAEGGARRSIGLLSTLVAHEDGDASVHGVDGHYLSRNGGFATDFQLMLSDTSAATGFGGFADFRFIPRQGRQHSLQFDYFDDELDINDLGFLRRNDAMGFRYGYQRSDSGGDRFKSVFTNFYLQQEYNTDRLHVDSGLFAGQELLFDNNHLFFYELNYLPERWDDRNSDGNGAYLIEDRWQYGIQWRNSRAARLNTRITLRNYQEDLGGSNRQYEIRFTWRPVDQLGADFRLRYEDRNGWLIHNGNGDFTTYGAEVWRPQLDFDYFLTARQQFRISAQWAGIKATEQKRYSLPPRRGALLDDNRGITDSRDFSISRVSFQMRYRWEIAPLSDLFVVYTRGSNIPSAPDEDFRDLLSDAWTDREVDVLVVKLRYRMGS